VEEVEDPKDSLGEVVAQMLVEESSSASRHCVGVVGRLVMGCGCGCRSNWRRLRCGCDHCFGSCCGSNDGCSVIESMRVAWELSPCCRLVKD
jgi:hypothetical protein